MISISPTEIAAAKAVPIARIVGMVVRLGRDGFGLCPFHDDHRPTNFHIHPAANIFKCFACGAGGDPIAWVQRIRGVDFPTAVRELVGAATNAFPRDSFRGTKAPRETEVPSLVSELWRAASAPNLAKWYLESRGIALKALPEALRGHKRVWCKEVGEPRPAMLAAITDSAGRMTSVQRIYIEPRLIYDGETEFSKGARAADLRDPKKTIGPMGAGAVKLAAAGEILGLCEGVESALAAAALFRLPVWGTCGLSRWGKPAHWSAPREGIEPYWVEETPSTIWIPRSVRHLILFADNDESGIGRRIADHAVSWWRRQGLNAQAEYPERGDWCEMLK